MRNHGTVLVDGVPVAAESGSLIETAQACGSYNRFSIVCQLTGCSGYVAGPTFEIVQFLHDGTLEVREPGKMQIMQAKVQDGRIYVGNGGTPCNSYELYNVAGFPRQLASLIGFLGLGNSQVLVVDLG